MEKEWYRTGIWTGLGWAVCLISGFYLKFGIEWMKEEREMLSLFIVICSIGAGWVGYGASKYYYTQRNTYIPSGTKTCEVKDREKLMQWKMHKYRMTGNLLYTLSKIFAIAAPVYLLAYLDNSLYLRSDIFTVILLSLLALGCYFGYKKLKNKY